MRGLLGAAKVDFIKMREKRLAVDAQFILTCVK
jgi:hypothetical protein